MSRQQPELPDFFDSIKAPEIRDFLGQYWQELFAFWSEQADSDNLEALFPKCKVELAASLSEHVLSKKIGRLRHDAGQAFNNALTIIILRQKLLEKELEKKDSDLILDPETEREVRGNLQSLQKSIVNFNQAFSELSGQEMSHLLVQVVSLFYVISSFKLLIQPNSNSISLMQAREQLKQILDFYLQYLLSLGGMLSQVHTQIDQVAKSLGLKAADFNLESGGDSSLSPFLSDLATDFFVVNSLITKLQLFLFEFRNLILGKESEKSKVSLIDILQMAGGDYKFTADQRRVELVLVLPERVEAASMFQIQGKFMDLFRAIGNLIHNAIKFTDPEGRVTVSLYLNAYNQPIIKIEDQGIGMPAEFIQGGWSSLLFQQGERVDLAMPGSGTGMPQVLEAVREHDGHIWVKSELGRGTTFTIIFPRYNPEDDRVALGNQNSGGGK